MNCQNRDDTQLQQFKLAWVSAAIKMTRALLGFSVFFAVLNFNIYADDDTLKPQNVIIQSSYLEKVDLPSIAHATFDIRYPTDCSPRPLSPRTCRYRPDEQLITQTQMPYLAQKLSPSCP